MEKKKMLMQIINTVIRKGYDMFYYDGQSALFTDDKLDIGVVVFPATEITAERTVISVSHSDNYESKDSIVAYQAVQDIEDVNKIFADLERKPSSAFLDFVAKKGDSHVFLVVCMRYKSTINENTTKEELLSLPKIGKVTAEKILKLQQEFKELYNF